MLVILWVFLRPMRAQLIALAETARTEGHADRLKALLGGELRSLLLFLPVLVLLLIAVGELMSLTLEPVVHLLILTSLKSVLHLTDGAASGAAVLGGLGALLLLVASGVLAYIAIFVIFTGKWREIVRARFHDGRAFAEQRWFFRQGLPGLIWTLAFPAAFSFGLLAVVRALAPTDQGWDQQGVTAGDLVLWPLIGFGAFWVLAWALRVFAVLGRLRRFDAAGG
jgi:hypothetical protein